MQLAIDKKNERGEIPPLLLKRSEDNSDRANPLNPKTTFNHNRWISNQNPQPEADVDTQQISEKKHACRSGRDIQNLWPKPLESNRTKLQPHAAYTCRIYCNQMLDLQPHTQ
jgi:hypothetical protein